MGIIISIVNEAVLVFPFQGEEEWLLLHLRLAVDPFVTIHLHSRETSVFCILMIGLKSSLLGLSLTATPTWFKQEPTRVSARDS